MSSPRRFATYYALNSEGDWIKRKVTTEQTFNRHSVSMESRVIEQQTG